MAIRLSQNPTDVSTMFKSVRRYALESQGRRNFRPGAFWWFWRANMYLEPIHPQQAVAMYISEISEEKAQATVYSHRSRLNHFLEWCEEEEIENMNHLTGRDMHRYKLWRRSRKDPKTGKEPNRVTMKTQLDTLRVAARYWVSIEAIAEGIPEKILSPELGNGDNERDEMLDSQVAKDILDYLNTYEYASRDHVTMLLLWHCLLRRGSLRAVDQQDYSPNEESIEVCHRPETGTPLKNKSDGHRFIGLKSGVNAVVADYVNNQRVDIMDGHGRSPLITTPHGRAHPGTIQTSIYAVTRPCKVSGECPHSRDPNECDAAQRRGDASGCPSSLGPHAVRRGAITHWLSEGIPEAVVSDRSNCNPETLSKHYDQRSEQDKMKQRRQYLTDI